MALFAMLQAVQVTGTVRDSAVGLPIAGVVVQLLDSAGRSYAIVEDPLLAALGATFVAIW